MTAKLLKIQMISQVNQVYLNLLTKEVPNLVTKKNENDTGSSDGSFANRLATAAKAKI